MVETASGPGWTVPNITGAFCVQHLSENYAELCRRVAVKLARKRPSPLLSGSAQAWAAGIVYAVAKVNALFYVSHKLHMKARDLCALLGVSESHASNKAREILDMLEIGHLDPRRPLWKQSGW